MRGEPSPGLRERVPDAMGYPNFHDKTQSRITGIDWTVL